MILLFWVLNFAISWFNAWGCGKTWTESKHEGGVPHFLNWCGAVMSAAGFTWCYLVILGGVGASIPWKHDDGTITPLLSAHAAQAFAELGYLVVIFPILGSGLALTVHSWGVAWRRRNFSDVAVAGWNSYAQVYNTVSAVREVGRAGRGLGSFFSSKDDEDSDLVKLAVVVLVAVAALGGCLTTRAIIRATARSTAQYRHFQCAFNDVKTERSR